MAKTIPCSTPTCDNLIAEYNASGLCGRCNRSWYYWRHNKRNVSNRLDQLVFQRKRLSFFMDEFITKK